MEIERINENTIKFYISYLDIEERGFVREEIWNNRERSEQLFWKMMEEVNHKEDFVVEGPLWIQVQALEKGLEVVVTKSQIAKDNANFNLPSESDDNDYPIDEKIESLLESKFGQDVAYNNAKKEEKANGEDFSIIVRFNDFEDVIQLSHSFDQAMSGKSEKLYHYNGHYYLYVDFALEELEYDEQENIWSRILEFSTDSNITCHMLESYGKLIIDENVLEEMKVHFPK